jgi:Carboxylesterase family
MEGTLFALLENTNITSWTPEYYYGLLTSTLGPYASIVNDTLPFSLYANTPYPAYYATSNVVTQLSFFCPSILALQSTVAAGQPAWAYLWGHSPSCIWDYSFNVAGPVIAQQIMQLVGATHTSEIAFVFNQTTRLPEPNGTCNLDAAEVEIAKYVVNAWTNMAETQNPGNDWPQWNPDTSMGLLVVNSTSYGHIDFTVCQKLNSVLNALGNGSITANQNPTTTSAASATSSTAASSAIQLTTDNIFLSFMVMIAFNVVL